MSKNKRTPSPDFSAVSTGQIKLSYYGNFYDTDPIPMSLDGIVSIIKSDPGLERLTNQHRAQRTIQMDETRPAIERKNAKQVADKLKAQFPVISGSTVLAGGKKMTDVQYLLPFVGIDIDKEAQSMKQAIKARIMSDPHVIFSCGSPSGNGDRALFLIDNVQELQRLWDDTPTDSARNAMFRYMWNQVAQHCEQHWGVVLDSNCAKPVQTYSLAHDSMVYYNTDAQPFHIDMSRYQPPRPGRRKAAAAPAASAVSPAPGNAAAPSSQLEAVIAIAERKAASKGVHAADGRNSYLHFIASVANQYGIDPTEITAWAHATMLEDDFTAEEISKCIGSAYKRTDEHGTCQLMTSVLDEVEKHLREIADFRYNQITSRIEICYRQGAILTADGKTWRPIQDRDVKTFYTRVKKQVKTNLSDVDAVIYSHNFAKEYHALQEYLEQLPQQWDPSQTDHIRTLFDHLLLANPELAPRLYPYFKQWFVRFIALALGITDRNQLAVALIGKENIGKTFFFENILPPELKEYYQQVKPTDKFDRDMDILLSQKLIACLDERSISSKDADAFKAMMGGGLRSVRKPYGREPELLVQRCSMGLTNNDQQYIGFREGTRRLLSIEIIGTKSFKEFPIDYTGLYAQAYYEVQHGGVREAFTQQEVAELKALNEDFIVTDPCEDAILTYFEVPCATNHGKATWMTATEILARVSARNNDEINSTTLGNALARLGFKKKKISTWRYRVVEHDPKSDVVMVESDDFDYAEAD